jgi:uncharacterized protein (DUF779 family)
MREKRMASNEPLQKVSATPAAMELLAEIIADLGPLLFHQSGGRCDDWLPTRYRHRGQCIGPKHLFAPPCG